MELNFNAVIRALGPNAAFIIANKARAPGDYLFETLLPEQNRPTYNVTQGTMTIRATMAGAVGMDSNYPEVGVIQGSTFTENTAKIANQTTLNEATLREMQALLQTLNGQNLISVDDILAQEVLNFLNKLVIQPQLDTREYLRGAALTLGAINWAFNGKTLAVDYGLPSGNLMTNRTSTAGYGGSASVFWADMRAQATLLKNNVRARIMHPDTLNMILAQSANAVFVAAQNGNLFSLKKFVSINGTNSISTDARDTIDIITYDKEGEILDPANPGQTIIVPFMSRGKIIAIGNNSDAGYRVGEGSTANPADAQALGYTHMAPTIEGGGKMGTWAEVDTPAERPWQVRGRAVSNTLPVITAPTKVVVASTDMS